MNILNQTIFLKSLIIGIFSSIGLTLLGIFVVLKRAIFITLAISELSMLGLVFGLVLGISPYFGMITITFLGITAFIFYKNDKIFTEDKLIGIVYALAFSLSILLLSKSRFLQTHILESLSGNILLVLNTDLLVALIACLISVLFFVVFGRQLFFVYSDTDSSLTYGINYKLLNFLFFTVVGLNIISFLRSIGIILCFSYLSIPCSFAILSAKNIKQLIYKSIIISLVSTLLGVFFSFIFDLPLGPTIVLSLILVGFLLSKF